MATLVIGTRGSPLALVQANWVAAGIAAHYPGVRISTRIITTSADRDTRTSIRSASSTGVFVREIEEALCGENGKHLLRTATAAVLGPITARTVAGFGKRPEILPCESTVASLIEAIRHHYER